MAFGTMGCMDGVVFVSCFFSLIFPLLSSFVKKELSNIEQKKTDSSQLFEKKKTLIEIQGHSQNKEKKKLDKQ